MMAPESERATCPNCGRPDYHYHATNCPNAEALPCSEVVERLIQAGVIPVSGWHRKQAEAILHSWRERRVQELEEIVELSLQAWQYGAYFGEWDEKQAAKWQIEGDAIKQKLHRAITALAESRGLTCKQFGADQEGREA